MAFTLGVFDVFGSMIPGAAYLLVAGYVMQRLRWLDIASLVQSNTSLSILFIVIASYAMGTLTYGIGRSISFRLGRGMPQVQAVAQFLEACPAAQGRLFVGANPFVLLARIDLTSPSVAAEIQRLRAGGTMLRGLILPAAMAAGVSLVEVFFPGHRPEAFAALGTFMLIALGGYRRGREMTTWAHQRTLEVAFWIEDIDQRLGMTSGAPAGTP